MPYERLTSALTGGPGVSQGQDVKTVVNSIATGLEAAEVTLAAIVEHAETTDTALTALTDRVDTAEGEIAEVATAVNGLIGANYYPKLTDEMTPEQVRQAINASILTAYNMGGGAVNIPKGTYVINGAIIPLPLVRVRGAGLGLTIIKMDKDVNPSANSSEGYGNNANCINVQPRILIPSLPDKSWIEISDMTIDFNYPEIVATGAFSAEWATRTAGAALDNVGNGITARGAAGDFLHGLKIERVRCINAAFHGIAVYMNTSNIRVCNNEFENNGYRACHIHGDEGTETVEDIIVTGNLAVGNGVVAGALVANPASLNGGMYVFFHNAKRGIIANNIVRMDKGVGIHAWGNTIVGATSDSLVIEGNIIDRCATGILLGNGLNGLSVTGNVITYSRSQASGAGDAAKGRGIDCTATVTSMGASVTGNTVFGCDGMGVKLANIDGLSWAGNTVQNCNTTNENQAVVLSNIRHASISGGSIFNNGRVVADFCNQLAIEATMATNATETAGTHEVIVSGVFISGGQRGNAPTVVVQGGTAASPHCKAVTFQGNKIRRPLNAAGNVVDLTARDSRVMYNDILTGTILDKMTPGTTNQVVGNY